MFAHRSKFAGLAFARHAFWMWVCCALAAAGCANCRIPRIDPTGERLFVWSDPAAPVAAVGSTAPSFAPGAAPPFATATLPFPAAEANAATPIPGSMMPPPALTGATMPAAIPTPGISVSPSQVIAPVGSEVVMIATVTGDAGYPLTRENVEWMLNPEGPGQLVSPGTRRPWDILNCLHRYPKKISPVYAVNRTLTGPMVINRGTPTTADDIAIRDGQSWISVTSPREGTSQVTVFAPNVEGWDRRQQSATIYWVDAQWRFPSPGITPAGSRNTLLTTVSRQSDGGALSGWIVRYEIAGGPPAAFSPGGQQSVEIISNANGEAPAEIFQQSPAPGTNTIHIQVIRPPAAGVQQPQLPIGSGTTMQTWTSGDATLPAGTPLPSQPPIFTPVPSSGETPPPVLQPTPSTTQPPVLQPNTSEPQPQSSTPTPATPANLKVSVNAPPLAVVGSDVQFEIVVENRGTAAVTGLLVTDKFDEGLVHSSGSRAIERNLTDLQPGKTSRLAVNFRVGKAGELCQDVTVTAMGIAPVSTRSCVTASESPLPPEATPQPTEPAPTPAQPAQPEPQTPAPTLAAAQLTVVKRGPERRRVGESALFEIEVTNNTSKTFQNVEIADNHEVSLEPKSATGGSEWLSGNALGWKIAAIEPGRTIRREIELKCLRETPRACNRVTVTATDMDAVADDACLEIVADETAAPTAPVTPAGAPTITVKAVETSDPIRINGQTSYQILLTNTGDGPAFDVEVAIQFDEALQLLQHGGPTRGSAMAGAVRYPAIRELRAGETQTFDLRFKGVQAGTGKVRVEVTSRGQAQPITAEQTTEVLP
jgi:uncharacterized repeat protein (TIGR01451 family)